MGNKSSSNKSQKKNKKVKQHLRILTLGISGSGKTTFAKQMKIIANGGFEEHEKINHREIVYQNLISGLQELIKQTENTDQHQYIEPENRKHCRYFGNLQVIGTAVNEKIATKVQQLWEDPAIHNVWKLSPSFSPLMINLDYFIENLDRISKPDFVPTNEDVLRARQRTTGEQTTSFVSDRIAWEIVDVGGQKPERCKWELVLSKDPINAIIYFVSLDQYNILTTEEPGKTKMDISLQIFGELLQSDQIKQQIPIILFFNKTDLLESKLSDSENSEQFQKIFPSYTGDLESAFDCVKQKFLQQIPDSNAPKVHPHYICALNTTLMKNVFSTVRNQVLILRLNTYGMDI